MSLIKNTIPKVILSISILITLGSYFFYYQPLDSFVTTLFGYAVIIVAFSLPVGVVNLLQRNINSIMKREKDWYLNVWLLICAFIMTGAGVFFGTNNVIIIGRIKMSINLYHPCLPLCLLSSL